MGLDAQSHWLKLYKVCWVPVERGLSSSVSAVVPQLLLQAQLSAGPLCNLSLHALQRVVPAGLVTVDQLWPGQPSELNYILMRTHLLRKFVLPWIRFHSPRLPFRFAI